MSCRSSRRTCAQQGPCSLGNRRGEACDPIWPVLRPPPSVASLRCWPQGRPCTKWGCCSYRCLWNPSQWLLNVGSKGFVIAVEAPENDKLQSKETKYKQRRNPPVCLALFKSFLCLPSHTPPPPPNVFHQVKKMFRHCAAPISAQKRRNAWISAATKHDQRHCVTRRQRCLQNQSPSKKAIERQSTCRWVKTIHCNTHKNNVRHTALLGRARQEQRRG